MKKVILLATIAVFFTAGAFAQKYYDEVKNSLLIGQIDKAKESFDKNVTNEKFFSKPEGYMLKATLYANLAVDSSKMAEGDKNRAEADAALTKYKELDPETKLLDDQPYRNMPFNLYASYFNAGITDINNKAYEPAYEKFKQAVHYSDFLISKKIMDKAMDTASIYYAGLLAENTKHEDEALQYYKRIADKKITEYGGTPYESVYQGLVRYYATKNDKENFEKYKALAKELYPESEFFTYSMVDFAVGSSSDFNERLASLEKLLAANPEDYKANITFAELIYDTLNSRKANVVIPANAKELEIKMLAALNKASSLKPEELQPYLLMGDHYLLKSEKIGDTVRVLQREDSKVSAEKQKLATLEKLYAENYDLSKNNYEKAAEIFSKMTELDPRQKSSYRAIAGNLAQYYYNKSVEAKGAADKQKYEALEKKWDTLYTKLR